MNKNNDEVSLEQMKNDSRDLLRYFIRNQETIKWLVEHKDEIEKILFAKTEKMERKNRKCDRCGDETYSTEVCHGWSGISHEYALCGNCWDNHPGSCPESPGRSHFTCKKHM